MPTCHKPTAFLSLCLAFVLAIAMHPLQVLAQVGATSSVSGKISDQSGLIVEGATVTLTDSATRSVRTEISNEVGRYVFTNVIPGTYALSVTRTGFQTSQIEKQEVVVNVPVTLNISLSIGSVSQTVTVTSVAGAELQTTNSTMGTTLSGNTLLLLPNVGRDASALITYQAGVTAGGNVAGQANDANTFMVDGANNSNDMDGGNNVYTGGFGGSTNGSVPTPAESVEEFKVNTNNQTADFYSSAGGQVQMVTKRGTDILHGSLYDFYQGSFLNANSFINDYNKTKKQNVHQNRFGLSLGGPITHRRFLGGKTYLYGNYEGRRLPQALTFVRNVPSDLMRAGVLNFLDAAGNPVYYNLNPTAVTVNGVTYPGSSLDPRNIGINQQVSAIWSKYMPHSNFALAGDQINVVGYQGQIDSPVADDTGAVRLDHDFGDKYHLTSTYRIYKLRTFNTAQTDIGGFLPGDSLGKIAPIATRPVGPSLLVVNFTGSLTKNLTNNFSFNYTRNWWQWGTAGAPAQISGAPAALEIGGETPNALIPVNIDAQDSRARVWDGRDFYYKDDLSLLHNSHFMQFGGQIQANFVYHSRNDNGTTVIDSLVNIIGSGQTTSPSINFTGFLPTPCTATVTTKCLPASQISNYENDYAEVLGMVSQSQELASRTGDNLALQPLGTPLFDEDTMPSYDVYFSDTWQVKPTFTITYGMNYGIQMPPTEKNGKQVMLVDSAGKPVDVISYFQQRDAAAASGSFRTAAYNPLLGFENIRNTGRKYPFDPFYGGFGPHFSAAWNPNFTDGWTGRLFGRGSTVLRGGYARIYGRLNGVRLVLIPLLGVGFGQTVVCQDPSSPASTPSGGNGCTGPNGTNPTSAFRAGTDGQSAPLAVPTPTLPQPIFTGVGGQPTTGAQLQLAPNYRPESSDQLNITIQRQLPKDFLLEFGYLGVWSHNLYTDINLDQVPSMSVVGGQSFASAYANIEQAQLSHLTVSAQPFIEGALAGSSYCAGYATCTAALVAKQASNFSGQFVSNIWSAMAPNFNQGVFPAFNSSTGAGGTMPGLDQFTAADMDTSLGWANYAAGFISIQKRSTNGLTVNANLTYSHALSTIQSATGQSGSGNSPSDPLNLRADYGDATFDQRLHFNLLGLYNLPFYRTETGLLGRALGGWSVAPIFSIYTGVPIPMRGGSSQEFGQGFAEAKDSNAILVGGKSVLASQGAHYGIKGGSGIGTNGYGVNLFANPGAAFGNYRAPILGLDTTGGGNGSILRQPLFSNLDLSLAKETTIRERFGVTFQASFFNALNHVNWTATNFALNNPAGFGSLTPITAPRAIELGLRVHF
jgi:hypothetical protein